MSELEPREYCPECSGAVMIESEDPLEEYCLECDYYRAKGGRTGVIRED